MAETCKCCEQDIHTLHAELIHKARDIQFQLEYDNGGSPATIECLSEKNVQGLLEEFFANVGLPVTEQPIGSKNNSNIYYQLSHEMIPGTLEVELSGFDMNGKQSDTLRHYDIITTGPDAYKAFQFIVDPEKEGGLKTPPLQFEHLVVKYRKRITFNTKGGT